MARLVLSGTLKQVAGGIDTFDIDARDVRHLLRQLGERVPVLAEHLAKDSFAIAIDGEIYQDAWLEPLRPDSEVHLVPPIGGG